MLTIIDYSEKSIALIGETYNYRETLKNLNGTFNRFLKIGESKKSGWIFSKKREQDVRNFVETLG